MTKPIHNSEADNDREDPLDLLADGELDAKEAGFVMRRLLSDDAARNRWERLHLVRASLRGERVGCDSLVQRVHDALDQEPSHKSGPAALGQSWSRYALGGALAASVAVMAVVGLGDRMQHVGPSASPGFVSQTTALDRQFSASAVPVSFSAIPSPQRIVSAPDEQRLQTRQRIDRYMIRHGQLAGLQGLTALTPVLSAPDDVSVANPVIVTQPMMMVTEDARQ